MSWAPLREQISVGLSAEELRTLCFDLNVDYDALPGRAKDAKVRELIALLRRQGRLPALVVRMQALRPNVDWEALLPPSAAAESTPGWRPLARVLLLIALVAAAIVIAALLLNGRDPDLAATLPTSPVAAARSPVDTAPSAIAETPAAGNAPTATPSPPASCLEQHFAGIPADRQAAVEVGERARDVPVAEPDRVGATFSEPYAIQLTKNGDMVGALTFILRAEDVLFKITGVVDAGCAAVDDYRNVFHPSAGATLQNSDVFEMPLNGGTYSLRFNFQGTHVRYSFREIVPGTD